MSEDKIRRVLAALDERDLTVAWIARQIGESRQVVHNWLKGIKSPQDPTVFDRMLAVIEGTLSTFGSALTIDPMVEVRLSGVGSAGGWTNAEARESVMLPAQLVSADYRAVRIDGTSMLPHILPGDVAIFREWKVPKVGFVNACSKDGELMVKNVALVEGRMVLRSFNPDEPDSPADECIALGFLVGVYRDDGVETMFRHNRGGLRFD